MSKTLQHLGVFAKYWLPGNVKTRLATAIGHENAARLYREFARQTLRRLGGCGDQRSLWIWPAEHESDFRALAGSQWNIEHQPDGGLGQRVAAFFEHTLRPDDATTTRAGAVLVGTDCPTLQPEVIEQAFVVLQNRDCVVGPSADGGYYLIGLRRSQPQLFADINWSTSRVLQQTRQRISNLGLSCGDLSELNDIDNADDLETLVRQLQSLTHPGEYDLELLDVIEQCAEHLR